MLTMTLVIREEKRGINTQKTLDNFQEWLRDLAREEYYLAFNKIGFDRKDFLLHQYTLSVIDKIMLQYWHFSKTKESASSAVS